MFIYNGDNTWTVRFYDPNGVADYVTVNNMLPVNSAGQLVYADCGAMVNNSGSNTLWIPLAEKAYAQWNETGKEGRDGTNTYSDIQGGLPGLVYPQLTGGTASSYAVTGANEQSVIKALANNMAVAAGTDESTNPNSDAIAYGLYGSHAYGVIGYNSTTQLFTLYNPWGFDQPPEALSWTQLEQTCFEIDTANVSNTVPISAGVQSAAAPLGFAPTPARHDGRGRVRAGRCGQRGRGLELRSGAELRDRRRLAGPRSPLRRAGGGRPQHRKCRQGVDDGRRAARGHDALSALVAGERRVLPGSGQRGNRPRRPLFPSRGHWTRVIQTACRCQKKRNPCKSPGANWPAGACFWVAVSTSPLARYLVSLARCWNSNFCGGFSWAGAAA